MKTSRVLVLILSIFTLTAIAVSCASQTTMSTSKSEEKEKKEKTLVDHYGQLSIDGTHVVDKNGNPIQLRGMSLFWSQWMAQYWTPATIKWLRDDWKCTVVRAAMGVEKGGYLTNPEFERQKVETVVDAAIDLGIYVIVDYHAHEAEKDPEAAKEFFDYMSKKYGKYPNVIWEPYNEPLDTPEWSTVIKPYHEEVIKVIRANDPDNIIVCGTRIWSQRVDEAADDPIADENVAYTLHYYAKSHRQSLRDIAQKAIDKGVCLFVTEYGTCHYSGDGKIDPEQSKIWWEFLDEHKISWCNWSVADKVEAASIIKPGTSPSGGWTEEDLTPSGKLVREECVTKNAPVWAAVKK